MAQCQSPSLLSHSLPSSDFVSSLLFLIFTLERRWLLSGFVPLVLVAPTSILSRTHLHTVGIWLPSQLLVTPLLAWLCREQESPFAVQPLSSGSSSDGETGMCEQSVTTGTWCQRAFGFPLWYWTRCMLGNVYNVLNSEVFAGIYVYCFYLTLQTQRYCFGNQSWTVLRI